MEHGLVELGLLIVKCFGLFCSWLIACVLLIKYSFWQIARQRRKLAGVQLTDLDRMSGERFEEYLEILFERLGYDAVTTERFDKGADLLLTKEGIRTAVQAKCRAEERVGVEAVRAVIAALRPYRCSRGMVVTNGYFTRPAQQTAKDNGIELWDRDALAELILQFANPGQALPIPAPIAWLLHAPRQLPVAPLPANTLPAPYSCATCARQVTRGVQQYCLGQPGRFGGKVYCIDHQRAVSRQGGESENVVAAD